VGDREGGEKMKWIGVKERLPREHGETVVYVNDGDGYPYSDIGYYEGGLFRIGGEVVRTVTHWMPLPDPPDAANR
jgi:hypothetical protein